MQFEAECISGLEQFAAAELAGLVRGGAGKRTGDGRLPLSRKRERGPWGSRAAEGPHGGLSGGEGKPARVALAVGAPTPGVVPFEYDGPWPALLRLRTVVAVHAVLATGLPRPTALLGDSTFRQLVATVGHMRSLYPAGAFRTYRLSAAGADSAVFQRVLARLTEETGLRQAEDAGDVLLRFRRGPDGRFELLARISPRPLAARAWRVCNRPGSLNAAVASIMAGLTNPRPRDTYLNLACGSGTLLIERALLGGGKRLIGCDLAPDAIACAGQNVTAADVPVELADWDATALPLEAGSIDALTVDLPFGQLVGSHTDNATLYPALLAEAARVARPGALLAAITQQVRLFERSVDPEQWQSEAVFRPILSTSGGPIKPGIYVLRRLGA